MNTRLVQLLVTLPLPLNKRVERSAPFTTLCPYTVESDTNSLNTVLNTCTTDSTPRNMADNHPDTNSTDRITRPSGRAPRNSTSNAGFYTDINNKIIGPLIINNNVASSEETGEPPDTESIPSHTSESACNTSISENAHTPSSINDDLRTSGSATISEDSHGETETKMGAGDNNQMSGENQKKSQSSNESLKGKHRNPILLSMKTEAK